METTNNSNMPLIDDDISVSPTSPIEKPKKKRVREIFDFKSYYNSNTEFRERHKEKMRMKIKCDICNTQHGKTNYLSHLRSQKHILKQTIMENTPEFKKAQYDKVKGEIQQLIDNLNKKLKYFGVET